MAKGTPRKNPDGSFSYTFMGVKMTVKLDWAEPPPSGVAHPVKPVDDFPAVDSSGRAREDA